MAASAQRFSKRGLVDQIRPLTYLKALEFAGLAAFSTVLPIFMGAGLFGRFVLILSVTGLIQRVVTMGGGQLVFGRFIPEYEARGDHHASEVMFMHMLQFRAAATLLGAPVLYYALREVLPEATQWTLLAAVGSFVFASVSTPMFMVFFGFNRLALASTWEATNRILLVAIVLVFGAWTSLERAAFALVAVHLVALSVGLILTRRLYTFDRAIFDLAKMRRHVGFGVGTFVSSYLMGFPRMAGETALAVLGFADAQVGFFGLANSAASAFARLFGKLPKLLVPSVGAQETAGDRLSGERGFAATIKFSTAVLVAMVVGASWLADPVVRLVWGEEFAPVAPHLVLLTISLLPVPWIRTVLALAVVRDRVSASYRIGLVGVVALAVAALLAKPWLGPLSISLAIAVASAASGLVAVRFAADTEIPRLTRVVDHSAAIFALLLCLVVGRGNPWWTAVGLACYLGIVRLRAIFGLDELRSVGSFLWRGWRSRGEPGEGAPAQPAVASGESAQRRAEGPLEAGARRDPR